VGTIFFAHSSSPLICYVKDLGCLEECYSLSWWFRVSGDLSEHGCDRSWLDLFRELLIEMEYFEWDGVRFEKRTLALYFLAFQVLWQLSSITICSLGDFRVLEPSRPCFFNLSQTKPLLKWLVRTSPLSSLLRCWIINIERGRLYLSYSRVCCAECKCCISPASHHAVYILLINRPWRYTNAVGFQWQLDTSDEAGDGWPSWFSSCLARLQPTSVSNLPVLYVDAKEHHRRVPLPDNAEEHIARLPYWIGGYDLEVNVSNLQHIFRWLLKLIMISSDGEHSISGIWSQSSTIRRHGANWLWTKIPRCAQSYWFLGFVYLLLQDLIRALVDNTGCSVGGLKPAQFNKGQVCLDHHRFCLSFKIS
jgi:hypothetical protein